MLTWNRPQLDATALLLSRDYADAPTRRASERLLAQTVDAGWLYRVRDIQLAVTLEDDLRAGRPAEDLRLEWLAVRDPDVPLADWKRVDERLVDACVAVERWWEAGQTLQDLVAAPDTIRSHRIHEDDACGVVLVHFCLAVEAQHRTLGGEEGAKAARLGVRVADNLLERHLPRPSSAAEKLAASPLTDLLALAWARLANAYRILGRIPEANDAMNSSLVVEQTFVLNPWIAGEVASLHASLLKDEGLDLAKAEERIDEAIRVFEPFDTHLAAKSVVTKAEIQRLRRNAAYLATLEQAAPLVDGYRDVHAAEVTSTNLLYYLVKEARVRDVVRKRFLTPVPTLPAQLARRLCVEGCAELMLKRPDLAKILLEESALRFTGLARFFDAVLALLYLASACVLLGDLRDARDHLSTAWHLALANAHPLAERIGQLLDDTATPELSLKIQRLAFEAGGCLDPRAEAE